MSQTGPTSPNRPPDDLMRHPLPITSLFYFLIPQSTIPIAANATGFTGNWLPMGGESPSPSNGISRNLPNRKLGPHRRRSVQPMPDLHYPGAVRNEMWALSGADGLRGLRRLGIRRGPSVVFGVAVSHVRRYQRLHHPVASYRQASAGFPPPTAQHGTDHSARPAMTLIRTRAASRRP